MGKLSERLAHEYKFQTDEWATNRKESTFTLPSFVDISGKAFNDVTKKREAAKLSGLGDISQFLTANGLGKKDISKLKKDFTWNSESDGQDEKGGPDDGFLRRSEGGLSAQDINAINSVQKEKTKFDPKVKDIRDKVDFRKKMVDLIKKEEALGAKKRKLDSKKRKLDSKKRKLGKKQAKLAKREIVISEREAQLDIQKRELTRKEAELNQKEKDLAKRERVVSDRETQLKVPTGKNVEKGFSSKRKSRTVSL